MDMEGILRQPRRRKLRTLFLLEALVDWSGLFDHLQPQLPALLPSPTYIQNRMLQLQSRHGMGVTQRQTEQRRKIVGKGDASGWVGWLTYPYLYSFLSRINEK